MRGTGGRYRTQRTAVGVFVESPAQDHSGGASVFPVEPDYLHRAELSFGNGTGRGIPRKTDLRKPRSMGNPVNEFYSSVSWLDSRERGR